MSATLPMFSAIARRTLTIPMPSCDAERSFSSLKWVKDEWQQGLTAEFHLAAILSWSYFTTTVW